MKQQLVILELQENLLIAFVSEPKDKRVAAINIDEYTASEIGTLSDLNSLEILNTIKEQLGDLQVRFKKELKQRNWSFKKCKNPKVLLLTK